MRRVLVVDDKELMRDSVSTMLAREGWTVQSASNGATALRIIGEKKPDAVVTDLQMPEMSGVELLREIRRFDEQMPVVFMTAFGTVESAVEAMKLGAYDYLTKPFTGDQLIATMNRALEHGKLVRENAILQSQISAGPISSGRTGRGGTRDGGVQLVGRSEVIRSLKIQIRRIAQSQSTVLICGESGVGKEVVAQAVHDLGPRSSEVMLNVNCAALSASLLESELFGHERGAFTGADRLRKGRFELADNGSLLLDEISEVPTHLQAKLLRVLQERTFERVGSSVAQRTDVRVIATTNRDLSKEVVTGRFRQDLFYRLNVLPIAVEPLRHRLEDIEDLCNHFLELVARQEGREPKRLDEGAIRLMQTYRWPGNVRELGNICERANIFCEREVIPAEVIHPWLCGMSGSADLRSSTNRVGRRGDSLVEVTMPGLRFAGGKMADVETEPEGDAIAPSGDSELCSIEDESGHEDRGRREGLRVPFALCSEIGFDAPADMISIRPGKSLEEIERETIVATLRRNDGHRQRTAKDLGIAVRTLGLKLRKWKDLRLVDEDL